MSSIVPPLDYIPKLPGMGVNKAVNWFDEQADKVVEQVANSIREVLTLPEDIKCDDPRITKARKTLEDILKAVEDINKAIQQLQTVINTIKTIVNTAKTIKAAITAAQLLNPITAPVFIATQLQAIQDATIVNAIEALKQFKSVPPSVLSKLSSLIPVIIDAAAQLARPCDGSSIDVTISPELAKGVNGGAPSNMNAGSSNVSAPMPILVDVYDETNEKFLGKYHIIQTSRDNLSYWSIRLVTIDTFNNAVQLNNIGDIVRITCPAGQIFRARVISKDAVLTENEFCLKTIEELESICALYYGDVDYNDWVKTEFYNEDNVSEDDLIFRSDTIEQLLRQQQDLLKSLLEAPSKVYQGSGLPDPNIGKPGDYYVDLATNNVYGPKSSVELWGTNNFATAGSPVTDTGATNSQSTGMADQTSDAQSPNNSDTRSE